jgi:4a-hydroxytetrahydrobiopterin dehydratase
MKDAISPKQFHQSEGVEDWHVLGGDGATASFRTPSFAQSAKLVQAISALRASTTSAPPLTCGMTA